MMAVIYDIHIHVVYEVLLIDCRFIIFFVSSAAILNHWHIIVYFARGDTLLSWYGYIEVESSQFYEESERVY